MWIESTMVDGQWRFDDGSHHISHINMSGGPEEENVRTRVHGSIDLFYQDGLNEDLIH